jgi:hypothetical protein
MHLRRERNGRKRVSDVEIGIPMPVPDARDASATGFANSICYLRMSGR